MLEQLRAKPLDDVDRDLFGPAGAKQEKPAPGKPGEGPAEQVRRELGAAGLSDEEAPLLSVFRQMREAEGLLAAGQSGSRTQQVQQQIVTELAQLIEQARKNAAACQGANPQAQQAVDPRQSVPQAKPGGAQAKSGADPGAKPAAKSDAKPEPGEAKPPEPEDLRTLVKDAWGLLPERARSQMLELPVEEFLPKYEPLIIEYFKRLAEGDRARGRSTDESL